MERGIMKNVIFTSTLLIVMLCACGSGRKAAVRHGLVANIDTTVTVGPIDKRPMYTSNTLIIMYDEAVGKEPLKRAFGEYGAEIIYEYGIINGFAIRIPDGKDIKEAMAFFKKVDGVLSVERDHIYYIDDPVRPRLEVM